MRQPLDRRNLYASRPVRCCIRTSAKVAHQHSDDSESVSEACIVCDETYRDDLL